MTVYVDDMRAPLGRMLMSHMVAETDAELHAMADRIGVARRHHQGDHYDICQAARARAIGAGARPVTRRQLGLMTLWRRRLGRLPTPEVAEELHRRKTEV